MVQKKVKAKPAAEPKASKPRTAKRFGQKARTREEMIAESAYLKAAERNFEGDDCLNDWLRAEQEVDALLRKKTGKDSQA